MVVHLAAPVVAAALGFIGAKDCEDRNRSQAHDKDDDRDNDDDPEAARLSPLENSNNHRRQRSMMPSSQKSSSLMSSPDQYLPNGSSVRFLHGVGGMGNDSEGVRSMYSERTNSNQHRHMEVRLRSVGSHSTDDTATMTTPYDSYTRFVGGDFASGKVQNIKLPDTAGTTGCWTMAFSTRAEILATGLADKLDFLETVNFTSICSLPRSAKVSAIQWCPGAALLDPQEGVFGAWTSSGGGGEGTVTHSLLGGCEELVAVAGLDGHVGIYQLDATLVEFKGVQTIHECQVDAEIRCMAFKPLGGGKLVLAVGDKQGKVTVTTLYRDDDIGRVIATYPVVADLGGDAVLGLDIHVAKDNTERSILVLGTKSGRVIVYRLEMVGSNVGPSYAICGDEIWSTQRNGSVRAVVISRDGQQLSFGGYDKSLVRVDLSLLAVVRELSLQGTINTIALDPMDRFLVVGCRDKSVTFYDTSTFFPIKRLKTPGWVTSISWGVPGIWSDVVAVRSENQGISLLDLTPIHMTDIKLSSKEGFGSAVSWTPNGDFLARVTGDSIHVVDSRCAFSLCAQIRIPGSSLRSIAFSPTYRRDAAARASEDRSLLAAVGLDGRLYVLEFIAPDKIALVESTFVENNLWAVSWSEDGKKLATGGKGKTLSLFSADKELRLVDSAKLEGRIWDIGFAPSNISGAEESSGEKADGCSIAVASGDYKTIFFDSSLRATLQVVRPRTVRCLDYHPNLPLIAVGDGAGTMAIVDYRAEETIKELELGGRINVLRFSPRGDFLLVGTDDCTFTLHETNHYKVVQEYRRDGFALSASFSPAGKYLALGSSNEPYGVMRMGALLGIDLVPLNGMYAKLPKWALKETLYRSGFGPSLLQRHMMRGSQDSFHWVTSTLKEHPDAIYTMNRHRNEVSLQTALRLRKVKLLQVVLRTLVDGSLDKRNKGKRSILTTELPVTARKTIKALLLNHPAALMVEILQSMTFVKVPFAKLHVMTRDKKMLCASQNYLDPWQTKSVANDQEDDEDKMTRTPAVLPIPGLGSMDFLFALVTRAPATAFDNEAMRVVLRVLWENHIRRYYIIDTIIFVCYYALWIMLIESKASWTEGDTEQSAISDKAIAIAILVLNSLFAAKEFVQSNLGRRRGYFFSMWNQVDIASIILVYGYASSATLNGSRGQDLVPLAVVTTLLLTMKLISYLRAFNQTGWLITVLTHSFWDVRGFLVVLLSILVGFSAAFRLLFANNQPVCDLEIDEETDELVQQCFENPFGSFRRSILSTFELTILGSYEPSLLYESPNRTLSILVFILAVTCVLVVALNALISLLADSYARVQEDATANKRKEKAELIVEYMMLLPRWKRRRIEKESQYFHALLESDADGDLIVEDDDWNGGLHALKEDMEENSKLHAETQLKAMENLKSDFEKEIGTFRSEMLSVLQDLSEDVKAMKKNQTEGGVTFSGKRVAGAVKAVKSIHRRGTSIFQEK